MEEKNEAWKILLKSLQESEDKIRTLQQLEIDLLSKLLNREDDVKSLIKVIAELKFQPSTVITENKRVEGE